MSTSLEIRRTVNRINNLLLNGQINPKTANSLLYGCNVALGAVRTDEQAAKIAELEKILDEMKKE